MTHQDRPHREDVDVLDGHALRRWALLVLARLEEYREAIDALNVFPVPDDDTGTNLYRTWAAALQSATADTDTSSSPHTQIAALARGTLLAARGNSGVLLGQLVGGLVDGLADATRATGASLGNGDSIGESDGAGGADRRVAISPQALAKAFVLADERAWAGVSDPVEGTILSVSRLAAQAAAAAAAAGLPLAEVTGAALGGAQRALAATPAQLPSLARAGVVDAGGAGLVVILTALHEVVTGERVAVPIPFPLRPLPSQDLGGVSPLGSGPRDQRVQYEVMYLLDIDEARLEQRGAAASADLATGLGAIGDSVVLGGDGRPTAVHVHTPEAGQAVEIGLALGAVSGIRIEVLPASPGADPECGPLDHVVPTGARAASPPVALGVVVCVSGAGLSRLFTEAGAQVVTDQPGLRATPQTILDAIRAAGAGRVVVLPNDRDTRMAARAATALAREEGLRAEVLRSDSPVQAVAALALYEPDGDPDDTIEAMTAVAGAVRTGQVVLATRRALTDAGWCHVGDALGIVNDVVIVVGADRTDVAVEVVRALSGEREELPELLTLVCGDGAHDLGDTVAARIARDFPDLEVSLLHGDQPVYTLLIGVE